MTAPLYTAADYTAALKALMPQGRVWPKEVTSVMSQAVGTLAPTFERLNARANQLLIDAFPSTTYELLPEWEATLGLPDPCAGLSPTIQQRQKQVVARFAGLGGQSIPYCIGYAANLGYTITVSEFTPFRMGQQRMGCQLGSQDWAFTWAVNAPLYSLISFRMGASAMGEPLETFGNAVLQCEIESIAPAHTIVQFRYS